MIETWTARGPGNAVEQPVCLIVNGRSKMILMRIPSYQITKRRRMLHYIIIIRVFIASSSNSSRVVGGGSRYSVLPRYLVVHSPLPALCRI